MKNIFKRLIRDNKIANLLLRNLLRFLLRYSKSLHGLTHFYRVYGVVSLNIQNIIFDIYALADDHIANEIYYNQGYEIDEFKLVHEIVKSSRIFVDIGANTGIFSIYAAKCNPDLRVLSFEPHPFNYVRLKKNIEINHIDSIQAHQLALGQVESEIKFTIPEDNSISTTSSVNEAFAKHFQEVPQKSIIINQVSLDSILIDYNICSRDLIKIDVEYYELDVLKGAIKTLTEAKPLLIIEILDYDALIGQSPQMRGKIDKYHAIDIKSFLFSLDYSVYGISSEGICPIESVLNQKARNFLFAPRDLPIKNCSFDQLHILLK